MCDWASQRASQRMTVVWEERGICRKLKEGRGTKDYLVGALKSTQNFFFLKKEP